MFLVVCIYVCLCCFKVKADLAKLILPFVFSVCKDKHRHINILLTLYTVGDCVCLAIGVFKLVLFFVHIKTVCE